jgi:hypothetical protein
LRLGLESADGVVILRHQLAAKLLRPPGIARRSVRAAALDCLLQTAEECLAWFAVRDVAVHLLADGIIDQAIYVV